MGCFSSKPRDSHRASQDVFDPEKVDLGLFHLMTCALILKRELFP